MYQTKIDAIEQVYASPLNAIREATYSFTTSTRGACNTQKIEDRLIERGKKKEETLKKIKAISLQEEQDSMRDRPQINPISDWIVS